MVSLWGQMLGVPARLACGALLPCECLAFQGQEVVAGEILRGSRGEQLPAHDVSIVQGITNESGPDQLRSLHGQQAV